MHVGRTTVGELLGGVRWTTDLLSAGVQVRHGTRLGDVVTLRRERILPRRFPTHDFCYLGLEHVEGQSGGLVGFAPTPGSAIRSECTVFRHGDVLYGRLRPVLNKVYAAVGEVHTGVCTPEFLVLVPDRKRVLPRFLREVLAARWVQDHVAALVSGSALPRLQADDLLDLEVPVPPVKAQREVEARLQEVAERRERLRVEVEGLPGRVRRALERALGEGVPFRLEDQARSSPGDLNRLPAMDGGATGSHGGEKEAS